jgi:hypothetical protein
LRDAQAESAGTLVAAALAGAWRREPPAVTLGGDDLAQIAPLLDGSGAGALVWWKLRRSPLCEGEAAQGFRQSYRLQTLRAAVREGEIESLSALLGSAGVDAVLVKGWAAGRAYPEQGLRPTGDIDLCVRSEQYRKAKEVLASPEGRRFWVDLHEGVAELGDRAAAELYGRTRVLRLGGARVRVLGEEDHLRLLCYHLLRHGAWRPVWLCDVAASFESRGAGFDWDYLLGGRRADWVLSALGLAHRLLGASIGGTPAAGAAGRLPRWLVPVVLARWARPFATEQSPHTYGAPMAAYLRRPRGLLKGLRRRWPGPVEATVAAGGHFDSLPRWPFQLANCFTRAARFLAGTSNAAAD